MAADAQIEARSRKNVWPLVYDLRLGGENSDPFYGEVAAFSARVATEIGSRAWSALDGYSRYVGNILREKPRSRNEYGLELLTAGMALRLYGGAADRTPCLVIVLARELFRIRRRSGRCKRAADFLRAGLFQIFMRRTLREGTKGFAEGRAPVGTEPQDWLDRLPRLIGWMQATGDFEQEWRRLDNWRRYWDELAAPAAEEQIALALALFGWFALEADRALGKYTAGVESFLEHAHARRFWREDQIFCGRRAVEYHVGMVAAAVMNEGLRADFEGKPRKVLLVPTCMRGAHADACKAVLRGMDLKCAGCDPDCTVHRITRSMRRQAVEVYLVPHASSFSRWLQRWQNDPSVGVGAVACLMNILPGGYEMRARGIASQCVPLDYPGCAKHWTRDGVPTSVNEERLVRIVTSGK